MRWLLVLGFASVTMAVAPQVPSDHWADGTTVTRRRAIVGPSELSFSMPTDCAVGRDGSLYVLDGVNHRVVVYDAEGRFCSQFGTQGNGPGQFKFPLGITIAQSGKVFVADSGNGRFQVFSRAGEFVEAVSLPKTASHMPNDPSDLIVDDTLNRLYVVDNDNHKLHVYDLQAHRFVDVWGGPGQGRLQFRYPFLMDISDQGYLFVVEPINTRVQVLSSKGKFVSFVGQWGVKRGQLFRPKGVAVVGRRVYVTDSYLGRVQMFDMRGEFLGMLSDATGKAIALTTPTGITADIPNKRLYVVELKVNRVCRLDVE